MTKADWYDPQLHPKILEFCQHYETVILPTKPYHPEHKGKVEAGVKYVQNNALKGRIYHALGEQNQFLCHWETQIADTRIHGTTRKQVGKMFLELEKPKLKPLNPSLFPCFEEFQRVVHRDGHIEVRKAFYSLPPEYVTRTVWVRCEMRLVRIFNHRFEQIALHASSEPGRFNTDSKHIHSHKISAVEKGSAYLLERCQSIGEHCHQWAIAVLANRGPQALRVLQGLLSLAGKYSYRKIDEACRLALPHQAWRLAQLRSLLDRPCQQQELEFSQQHPLIRPMQEYQNIVPACFDSKANTDQTV